MTEFTPVAKKEMITPGMKKKVEYNGEPVLITNVEGTYYAVSNLCTHNRLPLSTGMLTGHIIRCAYHGSEFDVRTGEALTKPAHEPLAVYEVKVEGDDIMLGAKKSS